MLTEQCGNLNDEIRFPVNAHLFFDKLKTKLFLI